MAPHLRSARRSAPRLAGLATVFALSPTAAAAPTTVAPSPREAATLDVAAPVDDPAPATAGAAPAASVTTSAAATPTTPEAGGAPANPAATPTATTSATVNASAPAATSPAPADDPLSHRHHKTGPHADPGQQIREPAATPPSSTTPTEKPVAFTPGAQIYLRGQSRYNSNQDPAVGDRQHDIIERVRLSLLATVGPVKAFVQFQDARVWGFEQSTVSNEANTDLHQGYLEVGREDSERGGFIRIGRQEIVLGTRKLFADRNWNPIGQSFDSVRLHGKLGRFGGELVGLMLAPPRDLQIPDANDPTMTTTLHTRGTYAGMAMLTADLHSAFKSEVSVLGISERPTAATPTTERDILNAGARIYGEFIPGLRYDVEGYGQVGKNLGLRHRAFAAWGELGYVAVANKYKPGIFGRYTYASGSRCTGATGTACGEAESHDFYRFFGLRHSYYGLVDRTGLTNLGDLEFGASVSPHKQVDVTLGYHWFQLAQSTGRWIGGQGDNLVGKVWDPNNANKNLGQEIDLVVNYKPIPQLTIQPGYGVFIPMAAGRDLSGPAAQHFPYLWMIANF